MIHFRGDISDVLAMSKCWSNTDYTGDKADLVLVSLVPVKTPESAVSASSHASAALASGERV